MERPEHSIRKICVITERRADYSRLKPVLQKIKQDPMLELFIVASGAHLLSETGRTIDLIKQDGFSIDTNIQMFSEDKSDTGVEMSRALGRALIEITNALEKIKPDILLIGFDLGAHLAGAIAGAHMNIPVAHIQGGEITGTIDESIRHAITKFAHIHFPSTAKSAERIIKMGENPKYVFTVGCPAIDAICNTKFIPAHKLAEKFNINLSKPLILLIQHPVTTEVNEAENQIIKTLSAIKKINEQVILIHPNIDAGGRRILKIIKRTKIKRYKNLPSETFLSLMNITNVIVGNSSSGIREAPSFKLPAVNIGTRQQGREQANNVISVDYDEKEIYSAIKKVLYDKEFKEKLKDCKNPYGDGKASERIVDILAKIKIKPEMLQKKIYE